MNEEVHGGEVMIDGKHKLTHEPCDPEAAEGGDPTRERETGSCDSGGDSTESGDEERGRDDLEGGNGTESLREREGVDDGNVGGRHEAHADKYSLCDKSSTEVRIRIFLDIRPPVNSSH